MPKYEDYKCSDDECNGRMEDVERPPCYEEGPKCPECGKTMQIDWMSKKGNFQLKGGKWFKTHGSY